MCIPQSIPLRSVNPTGEQRPVPVVRLKRFACRRLRPRSVASGSLLRYKHICSNPSSQRMTSLFWSLSRGMRLAIAVTQHGEVIVNRVRIRECCARRQDRYGEAGRVKKGRMLDEMVTVTDYHRKSVVRLLSSRTRKGRGGRVADRSSTVPTWRPCPGPLPTTVTGKPTPAGRTSRWPPCS